MEICLSGGVCVCAVLKQIMGEDDLNTYVTNIHIQIKKQTNSS